MNVSKIRLLLSVFLGLACVLTFHPSSLEAKGPRKRCRQQCAVPYRVYAPRTVTACPIYVWMNYGTYCSYYALYWDTCSPVNYDSTDCGLHAEGCVTCGLGDPYSAHCEDARFLINGLVRDNHPGHRGYGTNSESRYNRWDRPGLPGAAPDPTELTIISSDTLIVKFRHPRQPSNLIYAQVFFARVQLRTPIPEHPELSNILVARGMEINPVDDQYVNIDLTHLPPSTPSPINPISGAGHAYSFSHDGKDIPIIMHRGSVPHGQ